MRLRLRVPLQMKTITKIQEWFYSVCFRVVKSETGQMWFRRVQAQTPSSVKFPVLLFLGVFVSLVFFLLRNSLVFLGVFCLFSSAFKGSQGEKNPWCFWGFSLVFSKRPRKRRTGFWPSPSSGARTQWAPFSLSFQRQSKLTEFFFVCRAHQVWRRTQCQGELKVTELRWQRTPKRQIFAENRWFSQIHPFFWKSAKSKDFRRKPKIFADWALSP